jgi:hypothetical protein
MLILYCVSRLNYEPSSVRGWTASPRELFSGRKADSKRDFWCGFGDYVQCTVPETDNTLKARTEDAVAMLPTGNRTGSVRMLFLHTGKIITRDQFKVLPMPTSVIAILDRMAAADGIPITRTNTGVPTDSIRDFDSATSYLPTMITTPNHAEEDPDIAQLHSVGAGFELQLADEAGIDPARRGVYLQIHTISATTSPDPTHTLLTLSQDLGTRMGVRLGMRVRSGVTGRVAEQTQGPTTMILGVTEMGSGVTWTILGVTTQPERK